MDSVTALYKAAIDDGMEEITALFVRYAQHGWEKEFAAAYNCVVELQRLDPTVWVAIKNAQVVLPQSTSSLLGKEDPSGRETYEGTDIPKTFVPGRNLMLISLAAGLAFTTHAEHIYGGWVEPDAPYPDCTHQFLQAAEQAAAYAIGRMGNVHGFGNELWIHAPVLDMAKKEVVELGTRLGVSWKLTRSCYSEDVRPCLKCDSCEKRIRAFHANGMMDPALTVGEWELAKEYYELAT
jgi:7-cyano-7-deazaguanine synthase